MDTNKSLVAGNCDATETTKKASTPPKHMVTHGQTSASMFQNILLIWLDNNIDEENSNYYRNTINQLQCVVNNINMFNDADKCVDFLTDVYNENVFMIISSELCQNIVPLVHNVAQLHAIFIFCDNETVYEEWAKKWPKTKGVFSQILSICKALKEAAQQYEQNSIPMSFVNTSDDVSKQILDQLDPSFMYTQILKEILLTIKFEEKHIKEFFGYYRNMFVKDEGALHNFNKLEHNYHDKTPISWYSCEYFLYSTLNRALRLMDVDIIVKIGFFIRDLHLHIEQLHNKQFGDHQSGETFTVYRGQGMSKADFDQMMKTNGGLMSFNNFLSTSKDRDVSLIFAETNQSNPNLVGILFVMTIDPSNSTTPYASIKDATNFPQEAEILFSMHTVFRIRDIKPMDENERLFEVQLALTTDDDKDLRVVTDCIREETSSNLNGWFRLGSVLLKMGQSDKAHQIYHIILEQTTNYSEKGPIYNQLGIAKYHQGEYKQAIVYYESALEIQKKTLPSNHSDLVSIYNNMATVFNKTGEYAKALLYYEKDLEIEQQTLPPNHLSLANSYNNIGNVYFNMTDYLKALPFYEKTLEIQKKTLPWNHPDLTMSYNNIGNVCSVIGEYSKALLFLEKTLEIQKKTLPTNHPNLANSYNNIGNVYSSIREYSKALPYYEKALEIRQQSLPPNHLDLAMPYTNIGSVYAAIGEYSKALLCCERAIEIEQQSLPLNHPALAMFYNNIGNVYSTMGEYSKALLFHKKTLEIQEKALAPNHSDLVSTYICIGRVYNETGEYAKTLSYYEKALQIGQSSLPLNHSDLDSIYSSIGSVYDRMGEYAKALSFHEKALEIRQKSPFPNRLGLAMSYGDIANVYFEIPEYSKALSLYEKTLKIQENILPSNHPDLAKSYNNIGNVYYNMSNHSKALSYYEKAIEIRQQSLPLNHPSLAKSYSNIGVVYMKMGNYLKALSFFEQALTIFEQMLSPNQSELANAYNNTGSMYAAIGNYSKALLYCERAVNIGQAVLPRNHPVLQGYKTMLDLVKRNYN